MLFLDVQRERCPLRGVDTSQALTNAVFVYLKEFIVGYVCYCDIVDHHHCTDLSVWCCWVEQDGDTVLECRWMRGGDICSWFTTLETIKIQRNIEIRDC